MDERRYECTPDVPSLARIDHPIGLPAVCAAQATALHRNETRLVLKGVKEFPQRSCRLLRTETLSRRVNAEQRSPAGLRKTSVYGHVKQGPLTVKSCPRAIVAATSRRFGHMLSESELLRVVYEVIEQTEQQWLPFRQHRVALAVLWYCGGP